MSYASNEKQQTTPDGWNGTTKLKLECSEKIETYKYLGILEADTIKQLLETKLCSRNLIKGINTWAVSLVRYSGPFLK